MRRRFGSPGLLRAAPALMLLTAALVGVNLSAPAAFASVPILGSGSSFAFPALDAWTADVAKQDLTVNYNPVGSALGRQAFWTAQADFAASDIPFQQQNCPPGGQSGCLSEQTLVNESGRSYQYMPIVAGGESIPYNLQINGQQFTGLNLDSATLAKIFTGQITNWDDPAIAADNPGVSFPNQQIEVVVHSEGAGDTYNLSAYLANQQPAIWDAFSKANQLNPVNQPTEYYPCGSQSCTVPSAARFVGQNGSDGVINFVASPSGSGSIGYDETAYAVESGMPMASIKNAYGNYIQPNAVNVAVALSAATINPDHTEYLGGVYVNPDPRTYPISSYSYMIVPTSTVSPMSTSKGVTMSSFINYFLCQGQQDALALRYAPLPVNLVELGLSVEQQVPGAVPPAAVATCNNPAIIQNWYAANAIGTPQVAGSKAAASSAQARAAQAASHGAGASGRGGSSGGSSSGQSPAAGGAATGSSTRGVAGGASVTGGPSSYSGAGVGGSSAAGASGGSENLTSVRPIASGKPVTFGQKWSPSSSSAVIGLVFVLLLLGPPAIGLARRRN